MNATTPDPIACLLCGTTLTTSVTTNRNGRYAVGIVCPIDARHLRGFINDRAYVVEMLAQWADAAGRRDLALESALQGLQTPEGVPDATAG